MKRWFLTSLLGAILFTGAQAGHLTFSLDDIILLSQRGVSDQTLLLFVGNRKAGFQLDAKAIDRLVLAGVSDEVIRHLLSSETILPSPRTVVRPYPSYYYTPYYYGTSYSFGFSSYPAYWFGHYSGGGHRGVNHHSPSHVGRGHGVHKRRHSSGGQTHIGTGYSLSHGNNEQPHTSIAGRRHAGTGKVHAETGVNKHDSNRNSVRHSSGKSHSRRGGHSNSGGHGSRSGGHRGGRGGSH